MTHPIARIIIGHMMFYNYMRKVTGLENIPKGKFIVACNHSSYMDDFILPAFIIKHLDKKFAIYVNSRFYKNKLIVKLLNHFNCIPVDVSKDVKDEEKRKKRNEIAYNKALDSINKGMVFCVFPEGGRSTDGKLQKAKTGVARVALAAKIPVLPIGIIGTNKILPKGAALPRFKRADIIIGKPLYFEKYYGKTDYESYEEITKEIMKNIGKLIGQKYIY
jgi:1-acyl-sn-glycerol-3-phosphate acyltransferase